MLAMAAPIALKRHLEAVIGFDERKMNVLSSK